MSWSLSTSGHTSSREAEAELIADLKAVLRKEAYGASTGVLYSQHHGAVNLFDPEPAADAAETAEWAGSDDEPEASVQQLG